MSDIFNIGKNGEATVCDYLNEKDYFIIRKNFKCSFGEIDIIAIDKNELVFIEVKTRTSIKYGEARDSVNIYKKKHIKKAATYFLMQNNLENKAIRFDVIEVYLQNDKYNIIHLKNVLW